MVEPPVYGFQPVGAAEVERTDGRVAAAPQFPMPPFIPVLAVPVPFFPAFGAGMPPFGPPAFPMPGPAYPPPFMPPQPMGYPPPAAAYPVRRKRRGWLIALVIVIVLLLIGGGVTAAILLTRKSGSSSYNLGSASMSSGKIKVSKMVLKQDGSYLTLSGTYDNSKGLKGELLISVNAITDSGSSTVEFAIPVSKGTQKKFSAKRAFSKTLSGATLDMAQFERDVTVDEDNYPTDTTEPKSTMPTPRYTVPEEPDTTAPRSTTPEYDTTPYPREETD